MSAKLSTREYDILQNLIEYCNDKNIPVMSEIDNNITEATKDNDTYILNMFTNIRNYYGINNIIGFTY